MYSRCPHCANQYKLSVQQLRDQRGLLVCKRCGEAFDALQYLSDDTQAKTRGKFGKAYAKQANLAPAFWRVASVAMVLLLIVQLSYFEGSRLSLQPTLTFALEVVCTTGICNLPAYKNLDELTVSHSTLVAGADHSYVFSAAISNQSAFKQASPDLKLTLLNFNGQLVAERVFSAPEYLAGATQMAADETAEVRLSIVAPAAKVGGYTFTLL